MDAKSDKILLRRRDIFRLLGSTTALLLLAISLSSILTGCGGGGGGSNSGQSPGNASNQATQKSNVAVLPSDGSVTVSNATANSVTLSGALPQIAPGEVIISGQGDGLMRKVDSVSSANGTTTLQTEQATLEDVFQSANIDSSQTYDYSQYAEITPMASGVTTSEGSAAARPQATLSIHPVHLNLNNVILDSGNGGQITLGGSLDVTMSVEAAFNINLGGLQSAKFVTTLGVENNLSASGNLQSADYNVKVHVVHVVGEPFDIQAGIVPIVFVPTYDLYIKADGSVSASVSFSNQANFNLSLGVQYSKANGWQPIDTSSHSDTFTPSVSADVQATLTPLDFELGLTIDGAGLIQLESDIPNIDVALSAQSSPPGINVDVNAGIDLQIDASVVALGHTLADYQSPEISVASFNILNEFIPASTSVTLNGTLIDASSGSPLVGYTVAVQGTSLSATTDSNGDFSISGVSPGSVTLQFADPAGDPDGTYNIANVIGTNSNIGTIKIEGAPPSSPVKRKR